MKEYRCKRNNPSDMAYLISVLDPFNAQAFDLPTGWLVRWQHNQLAPIA